MFRKARAQILMIPILLAAFSAQSTFAAGGGQSPAAELHRLANQMRPYAGQLGKPEALKTLEKVDDQLGRLLDKQGARIAKDPALMHELLKLSALFCSVDPSLDSLFFLVEYGKHPTYAAALKKLPADDAACVSRARTETERLLREGNG